MNAPASTIPAIIGPKGANLKQVRDQTGVRIDIPRRDTLAPANGNANGASHDPSRTATPLPGTPVGGDEEEEEPTVPVTITGPQPPPRRDLPPMPGSQVFVNMVSESESFRRTLERDSEQSATRARSPSIRSQKIERTTSPIPAWLHRRPNTTGQGSRAMSPLPPLPSHH